jgi:PAS domain S-box-containing protein
VFTRLIKILMKITESSAGFLDLVRRDEAGSPSSETFVNAGLVWNDSLNMFLQQEQHSCSTRLSAVHYTAVMSVPGTGDIQPAQPRAGAVLLPLVFGGELGGIAGLTGRPGGYTSGLADALEPFTVTCAAIMRAVQRDRLDQVHAEEIRRQEETLRALIGNIPGAVYRCAVQSPWHLLVMTGEIQNISGYPPSVFLEGHAKTYADIVHPEDLALVDRTVADGVKAHRPYQIEYRIRHADGSARWVFERGCAFYDLAGNPVWLDGVILDVTDRKLAVDALRASEEKVRGILRAAPTGIGVVTERIFREVNTRLCEMTGFTRDEFLGSSARMLYADDAEFERVGRVKYAEIAARGTGSIETRWRRKDGTMIDVLLGSAPVYPEDLSLGIAFTALDITERKAADSLIQASLREKEVLLKEIHHRVKNNLQVISSLLSIQMSGVKEDSTRELFRESQNRVRSMALVHERLYRSVTLAEVDFGEYARAVTSDLVNSYARPGISCAVEADDICLGVDLAIPCGLILNEIVSNALKHAFVGRNRGSIRIAIGRDPAGEVSLRIDDDGIGHPLGEKWASASSMGTMLISSLSSQVGGTVTMVVNEGTHYRILIPSEG